MSEADKGGMGAANPSSDMDRAKQRIEEERRAAESLAREAKGAVGGLGERAKRAVAQQGEEVRQEAVSHLRHFSDAIKSAGDELAEKEPGVISDVVREAAYGLERFTDSLSRKQPSEVFGAMRDFGRRHPGAFLAGSMLMGFAVARFATASSPRRRLERADYGDELGQPGGYEPSLYEGGSASGASGRPAGSTTGGYPSAGVGAGLSGAGTTNTGAQSATGYGSGGSGAAGSATSGAYGSSGSGSSGSTSGTSFSSTGAGGASSSSTSKPAGTAGVSMGRPGQGATGTSTGSDPSRKPSTTDSTFGGQG